MVSPRAVVKLSRSPATAIALAKASTVAAMMPNKLTLLNTIWEFSPTFCIPNSAPVQG